MICCSPLCEGRKSNCHVEWLDCSCMEFSFRLSFCTLNDFSPAIQKSFIQDFAKQPTNHMKSWQQFHLRISEMPNNSDFLWNSKSTHFWEMNKVLLNFNSNSSEVKLRNKTSHDQQSSWGLCSVSNQFSLLDCQVFILHCINFLVQHHSCFCKEDLKSQCIVHSKAFHGSRRGKLTGGFGCDWSLETSEVWLGWCVLCRHWCNCLSWWDSNWTQAWLWPWHDVCMSMWCDVMTEVSWAPFFSLFSDDTLKNAEGKNCQHNEKISSNSQLRAFQQIVHATLKSKC